MKVFELKIGVRNGEMNRDMEDAVSTLTKFLYDTRQITNEDPIVVAGAGEIRVQVTCPEENSLRATSNNYVKDAWINVERLAGKSIEVAEVGIDLGYAGYSLPKNSTHLVLRVQGFSPLHCGDTLSAIPLYCIPPISHDGTSYDEINSWVRSWERLYGLWLGSNVGEDFALRQLQEHDSELSRMGRAVCGSIEAATGLPTYYYLMNYRDWSTAEDKGRKCPETGLDWLVNEETQEIAFRCEKSRLVSELSNNCIDD